MATATVQSLTNSERLLVAETEIERKTAASSSSAGARRQAKSDAR